MGGVVSVTPVVLGIDPQSSRLGLALVEYEPPHRAIWAVTVPINVPHEGWLYQQVGNALRETPSVTSITGDCEIVRIGIETPPYVNNHEVYRGISVVFGLVGAECHRRWSWAPQVSCSVGTWKKKIVGKGNATKTEVMDWAVGRTGWAFGDQDSADALAIATYAASVDVEEGA